MSLRVRFVYTQGATLGYSIERLSDGYNYDFNDGTFKNTTPTTLVSSLPAGPLRIGNYTATLTTDAPQFTNGDYAVYIHDTLAGSLVGIVAVVMYNNSDATVIPSGAGADPWATTLPGGYAPGSAGYKLGNLSGGGADPWTSDLSTYQAGTAGWQLHDYLKYAAPRAFGDATVNLDGSIIWFDPYTPTPTPRLLDAPKPLPGGRTVTKDPT